MFLGLGGGKGRDVVEAGVSGCRGESGEVGGLGMGRQEACVWS